MKIYARCSSCGSRLTKLINHHSEDTMIITIYPCARCAQVARIEGARRAARAEARQRKFATE